MTVRIPSRVVAVILSRLATAISFFTSSSTSPPQTTSTWERRSISRRISIPFLCSSGIVYPEKQVAKWAAIRYTADHIFDYIEIDEQHAIFEVEVPEGWVGKSIGELNIRRKFGINILGVKHAGKTDVSITPDTVLSGEMTILALGEYKALQKCFRI